MRETVEAAAVAWGAQTDSRGKPIMLYHGTESFGFTEVDIGQSVDGVAFFATDSENVAAGYAGEDGDLRRCLKNSQHFKKG